MALSSKRILILGGTGMLGHKFWLELPRRFPDTWVSVRKQKHDYARFGEIFQRQNVVESLDLNQLSRVAEVLQELRPDVVINCTAVTKRHESESVTSEIISVNSFLPHWLAETLARWNGRLIHFSTDCVFDGVRGDYSEDDTPNAKDLYGRTKALGEVTSPNAFVLRSSWIGRETGRGTELFEWFFAQRGKKARGFSKAFFTGFTSNQGVQLIGDIIENHSDLSGVWNITSPKISKYDLLKLINERFALGITLEKDESVVMNRNLNGTRYVEATGFQTPSWEDMIEEMVKDPTPYEHWRSQCI